MVTSFPAGWGGSRVGATGGYLIQTVEEQPAQGHQCAQISSVGERPPNQRFGSLLQVIDATPYRGKRVRYRAAVRAQVEDGRGRAQLWMRVDRSDSLSGFFDNMDDRPITSPRWGWYEIVGDVAADAQEIYVGAILVGDGKAWIDSASFEVVSDVSLGNEAPRPLTERGTENLVAFTRLLSYLRFFHPSDQVERARWQDWAIAGIPVAEGAESPEELADRLTSFFRPIAPTVQIFPTDLPDEDRPSVRLLRPGAAPRIVAWRHYGVGLMGSDRPYESRRIDNRPPPLSPGFASLSQTLDAHPYRGKKIRFRAALRAEVANGGRAQLWMRVDLARGRVGFFDNMHDRPVTSDRWQVYEIVGEVPAEAENIVVGVLFYPPGRARIDEASLEEVDGPEPRNPPNPLANPGFEESLAGDSIPGWLLSNVFRRQGFQARLSETDRYAGRQSVELELRQTPEPLPQPQVPFSADLEGGISVRIPLALYADGEGTLPHLPFQPPPSGKPGGFVPSGADRTTRLAAVALSWGVLQHFHPNLDAARKDWKAALRPALQAAATDENDAAFLRTLRRLIASLRDGQAVANQANLSPSHRLPLAWDWIEGRLVVTRVDPQPEPGLRPGDVVLKIGNRPVRDVLAAEEALTSAGNPGRLRSLALSNLELGAPDETVQIEVRRGRGESPPLSFSLRHSVPVSDSLSAAEPRPDKIAEIRPGIFYVDLTRVTDGDFAAALDRLARARGIVFDARGYPVISIGFLRHFLSAPLSSPQWQIPVVRRPDPAVPEYESSSWTLSPASPRLSAKIAFLADARTAGGNETCLALVESAKLGDIVGSPSAGVMTDSNSIPLPGGYYILWTAVRALGQDGKVFDGSGVQPTVPAARTIQGVAQGRDEVLQRAVDVVSRRRPWIRPADPRQPQEATP